MPDIDTVTTKEAAILLGVSERTLRRRIRSEHIEPIIVSDGPGVQNRYDRALILSLAKTSVTEAGHAMQVVQDASAGSDTEQLRADLTLVKRDVLSALTAVRGDVQRDMTTILDRLSTIEEALARIEAARQEQAPQRGWWARLLGR